MESSRSGRRWHGATMRSYRVSAPIGASVALQLQAGLDGFLAVEKHLLVKRGLFSSARRRQPYSWEMKNETAAEVMSIELQLVLAGSSGTVIIAVQATHRWRGLR